MWFWWYSLRRHCPILPLSLRVLMGVAIPQRGEDSSEPRDPQGGGSKSRRVEKYFLMKFCETKISYSNPQPLRDSSLRVAEPCNHSDFDLFAVANSSVANRSEWHRNRYLIYRERGAFPHFFITTCSQFAYSFVTTPLCRIQILICLFVEYVQCFGFMHKKRL